MEKLFKLKANGTTVRTEILAGLTTFMTMAYIIALNPNLLTNFAVGTPLWNGVFLATCIASAIGTICMAFFANKPFVMAPGMGLNSFFAVVVANIAVINECEYESAFQAALVIILVEGIVFLILTLLKVREKIVEAIPLGVRYGIAPAIGLMLMNVGLGSNVGIYSENGGPFYMMRDFFGALTPSIIKGNMGSGYDAMVLTVVTAFLGVFVMVVLAKKGVKAAVLLGMLFSSVIYWVRGGLDFGLALPYLAGGLLGSYKGAVSMVVYIMMGAVGLPVFSNFRGGLSVLAGPTGGYILGYLFAALAVGMVSSYWGASFWKLAIGMAGGLTLCYLFGTVWFVLLTGNGLAAALSACVLPFLPGDAVKIVSAAILLPELKKAISLSRKHGLA